MQIAILIVALILTLLMISRSLFLVISSARNNVARDRRTGFCEGDPYAAVSIMPVEGCCSAVNSIKAQRFLSEEAPGLPLADCGEVECSCRYVHHLDRRSGARDRRLVLNETADESGLWSMRNRRDSIGRRQGDIQVA
jgi:hypothetical protein